MRNIMNKNLNNTIKQLKRFFDSSGGTFIEPDREILMGAATFHEEGTVVPILKQDSNTYLHFYQICSRPFDSHSSSDKMRSSLFVQYQVVMAANDERFALDITYDALKALGIDPQNYVIEPLEDNWKSPSLGAFGTGWEVRVNGVEVAQVTYMQKMCGQKLNQPYIELTFGVDRLTAILSNTHDISLLSKAKEHDDDFDLEKEFEIFHEKEQKFNKQFDGVKSIEDYIEEQTSVSIDYGYKILLEYLHYASHAFNMLEIYKYQDSIVATHSKETLLKKIKKLSKKIASILYVDNLEKIKLHKEGCKDKNNIHTSYIELDLNIEDTIHAKSKEGRDSIAYSILRDDFPSITLDECLVYNLRAVKEPTEFAIDNFKKKIQSMCYVKIISVIHKGIDFDEYSRTSLICKTSGVPYGEFKDVEKGYRAFLCFIDTVLDRCNYGEASHEIYKFFISKIRGIHPAALCDECDLNFLSAFSEILEMLYSITLFGFTETKNLDFYRSKISSIAEHIKNIMTFEKDEPCFVVRNNVLNSIFDVAGNYINHRLHVSELLEDILKRIISSNTNSTIHKNIATHISKKINRLDVSFELCDMENIWKVFIVYKAFVRIKKKGCMSCFSENNIVKMPFFDLLYSSYEALSNIYVDGIFNKIDLDSELRDKTIEFLNLAASMNTHYSIEEIFPELSKFVDSHVDIDNFDGLKQALHRELK